MTADLRNGSGVSRGITVEVLTGKEGTVNLLDCLERMGMVGSGRGRISGAVGSGGVGRARDLVPGGEPDGHFAAVFVGAEAVTAWSKVRRYPTERGQKPLCMPG